MFERFTPAAREVMVLAQEQARLAKNNFIGTEHLLLGLIRNRDSVAGHALRNLGVSMEAAEQLVSDAAIQANEPERFGGVPFTPRAKKVLELSLREALELGHNYIGTEHILLALVREGTGLAARVLIDLAGGLDTVRDEVLRVVSREESSAADAEPPADPIVPRCRGCHTSLEGNLSYRVLAAQLDEDEITGGDEVRPVVVVYCARCGVSTGILAI